MQNVLDFYRGLKMQHVDWSTRHNSRAYRAGGVTATIAVLSLPLVLCFAAGFAIGRMV